MKRTSLTTLSAVALLVLSAVASAQGEGPVSYGRAGGPVGADRIHYIAANAEPSSADRAVEYAGIAGGPVGADRIRHIVDTSKPSTATQVAAYPGVAGGPVGSDRITWLFNRDWVEPPTMTVESSVTK